jgi:hypothetical protein
MADERQLANPRGRHSGLEVDQRISQLATFHDGMIDRVDYFDGPMEQALEAAGLRDRRCRGERGRAFVPKPRGQKWGNTRFLLAALAYRQPHGWSDCPTLEGSWRPSFRRSGGETMRALRIRCVPMLALAGVLCWLLDRRRTGEPSAQVVLGH